VRGRVGAQPIALLSANSRLVGSPQPLHTTSRLTPLVRYTFVAHDECSVLGFPCSPHVLPSDARLDAPLPWDHVDTGIAKWWLKTDLQRALEAATVPDCSHSGVDLRNTGDGIVFTTAAWLA
jgi:hypothetical protein